MCVSGTRASDETSSSTSSAGSGGVHARPRPQVHALVCYELRRGGPRRTRRGSSASSRTADSRRASRWESPRAPYSSRSAGRRTSRRRRRGPGIRTRDPRGGRARPTPEEARRARARPSVRTPARDVVTELTAGMIPGGEAAPVPAKRVGAETPRRRTRSRASAPRAGRTMEPRASGAPGRVRSQPTPTRRSPRPAGVRAVLQSPDGTRSRRGRRSIAQQADRTMDPATQAPRARRRRGEGATGEMPTRLKLAGHIGTPTTWRRRSGGASWTGSRRGGTDSTPRTRRSRRMISTPSSRTSGGDGDPTRRWFGRGVGATLARREDALRDPRRSPEARARGRERRETARLPGYLASLDRGDDETRAPTSSSDQASRRVGAQEKRRPAGAASPRLGLETASSRRRAARSSDDPPLRRARTPCWRRSWRCAAPWSLDAD